MNKPEKIERKDLNETLENFFNKGGHFNGTWKDLVAIYLFIIVTPFLWRYAGVLGEEDYKRNFSLKVREVKRSKLSDSEKSEVISRLIVDCGKTIGFRDCLAIAVTLIVVTKNI